MDSKLDREPLRLRKTWRQVLTVSPCILLCVTLLNVVLLATTALLVVQFHLFGPLDLRRVARQFGGASTDRYPIGRDPGPLIPPEGPGSNNPDPEQCCLSLDQVKLRQICMDMKMVNVPVQNNCSSPPPSTAINGLSRRITPPRITTPRTANSRLSTIPVFPATSSSTTNRPIDTRNQLRLPNDLRPFHYSITWRPDFYHSSVLNFSLNGHVEVYLHCDYPTSVISLNYRQLVIDRSSIQVTSQSRNASILWTGVQENRETEVFNITLSRLLTVGENIVVAMTFWGTINSDVVGIYWTEFTNGNNRSYMISTQMETTEARRAFPCVDDPAMKATFTVAVERQINFFTLANMPINFTVVNDKDPKWVTDVFQTTLPMSTYLVAFVVSEFTGVNVTSNGLSHTPIGLWAWKNYTKAGYLEYASTVAPAALSYYESYFNFSYKLPKLDLVSTPKLNFKGMENWGLITFQDSALLHDPVRSNTLQKLSVLEYVSHEILHNWLGNTVTIAWWDDLWLTEGFARYYQYRSIGNIYPTWNWEQLFIENVFYVGAMWNDDSGNAVPVYNPYLFTNSDLDNTFNDMTYNKGASIVRMLSNIIFGESDFNQAMKNYIQKYQYSIVDHDNLLDVLIQVLETTHRNLTVDLKEFAYTWIKQRGYPLISVTRNSSTNIFVTQKIFLYKPNSTIDETHPSPYGYLWDVPLTYITNYDPTPEFVWLHHQVANMTFQLARPLTDNDWFLFNYNVNGYYRVNYDDANWKALTSQLKADHTRIPVNNRAQLIEDSFTLPMSGNLSQVLGMKITEYLSMETDYLPWSLFQSNIYPVLRRLMDDSSLYNRLQNYVVSRLQNEYSQLGWNTNPAENITVILLRRLILEMACRANYDLCIIEALNRFRRWRVNSSDNQQVTPDQRLAVYCAVAANGTYDEWQFIKDRYHEMLGDFRGESEVLLQALTICTRNDTTLTWLLDSIQANNSTLSPSDYNTALWNIATSSQEGYLLTWKHIDRYGYNTVESMNILNALANVISTKTEADKFEVFLNQQYPGPQSSFDSMRKQIQQNINWREKNGADIDSWLTELHF